MAILGTNQYGKSEVRLVHVDRSRRPHGIRDWNVSISLAGQMEQVHLSGANDNVLPTDTQKNTVYAFARQLGGIEPEPFALALAEHFVTGQPTIQRARVSIDSYGWNSTGPHSFARSGGEIRTTTVVHDEQDGVSVIGGLRGLTLLNTTDSEFWGFARDEYTTLTETTDRMLATEVTARWRLWRVRDSDRDWSLIFTAARQALLDAFAETYSYSLQQTLYAMGSRVLAEVPQLCEVRLQLPNKHHFLVDLSPFGLSNDNAVYLAADRPYGLIEGQLLAEDAPPAGFAWT
jgi:urate oxidase